MHVYVWYQSNWLLWPLEYSWNMVGQWLELSNHCPTIFQTRENDPTSTSFHVIYFLELALLLQPHLGYSKQTHPIVLWNWGKGALDLSNLSHSSQTCPTRRYIIVGMTNLESSALLWERCRISRGWTSQRSGTCIGHWFLRQGGTPIARSRLTFPKICQLHKIAGHRGFAPGLIIEYV